MVLLSLGGESFAQQLLPGNMKFVPSAESEAAVLAAPTAQNTGDGGTSTIRMGYCNDKSGGSLTAQDGEGSYEYSAAILLPPSILDKYVGATINRVDFRPLSGGGDAVKVFVTDDLKKKNPLASKLLYPGEYSGKWNSVEFNKGVTIKEGDSLYVAYTIMATAGDRSIGLHADFGSSMIPGRNFFGVSGEWFSADPIRHNFSIRAYAEGGDLPANDVQVIELDSYDLVTMSSPMALSAVVRNFGTDAVKSVDVVVKNGDNPISEGTIALDTEILSNEEDTVKLNDITFKVEGNHRLKVEVTKVNGGADKFPDDNFGEKTVYAIRPDAQVQPRKVMMEYFKDEGRIYRPDSVYNIAFQKFDNVIWVQHHIGYAPDQFTLPEDYELLRFFTGNSFVPALMLDRNIFTGMEDPGPTYYVSSEVTLETLLYMCLDMPSYISVTPKTTLSSDNSSVDIKVSVAAQNKEMPFQADLRLQVYLVEDGVVSYAQEGFIGTPYVHDGIIRRYVTGAEGDPIDISDYADERTYTVTLDKEWKTDNMRVVAFVSNYSTDINYNSVYNAEETKLEAEGGVNGIVGDAAPSVWYDGVKLCATPDWRITAVYDRAGVQMSIEDSLSPGFYIVSVEKDGVATNCKVIVR